MAFVKICGLTRAEDVDAAVAAGARYIGLVFFEKSPRHVSVEQARALACLVPPGVVKVGLWVNPDDADMARVLNDVPLDMVQLHGAETPARVAGVRSQFGLPVMKAIGVSSAQDLDKTWDYGLVADQLLIDAKPPKGADLPGGNGLSFDWRLLVGRRFLKPWMLAGGLSPENVAEAVALTRAPGVDVSSGVEVAPGRKSGDLIRAFIQGAEK